MALSKTARTHLIYQFIILTLLFFSITYNEFFPNRKFLFLALIPMFAYQVLILSCCAELIPLPSWMNFTTAAIGNFASKESLEETPQSSPTTSFSKRDLAVNTEAASVVKRNDTGDWKEVIPNSEHLQTHSSKTPPSRTKRAKSWMNLRDSTNTCKQKLEILRKGSVENLATLTKQNEMDEKLDDKSSNLRTSSNFRRNTVLRSRSWKIKRSDQEVSKNTCPINRVKLASTQKPDEANSVSHDIQNEESELTKSYSFPFRQKRLQKWIELKENKTENPVNSSFPYWRAEGYNLAVKYEARRRRADSSPAGTADDENRTVSFEPSGSVRNSYSERPTDSMNTNKPCLKKTAAKANLTCLNKVKMGFSNLISKSKKPDCRPLNVNRDKKTYEKDLPDASLAAGGESIPVFPKLPKFLSPERPVLLYPKYIPFEKDRFEKDVKKKMLELCEDQTCF